MQVFGVEMLGGLDTGLGMEVVTAGTSRYPTPAHFTAFAQTGLHLVRKECKGVMVRWWSPGRRS